MNLKVLLFSCILACLVSSWTHAQSPNVPQRINPAQQPTKRLFDKLTSESQASADTKASRNGFLSSLQSAKEVDSAALMDQVLKGDASELLSREGLVGNLGLVLTVSVMSLAPAILLMTTCYVRVVVVLGLLRQALGTGQLPPTQVITSISIFITLFVMAPVWNDIYRDAIEPYTAEGSTMTADEAWASGTRPLRNFMFQQVEYAGNEDDIYLFHRYHARDAGPPKYREDVPLQVLLPAYMLSELKTAFLMGFMIFLPFLIIDLVVAAVTVSMGMMMLPPAMISLPFKLLLFVLVDGWHLVVVMLLNSFGTTG
ncbi:MAG: flagellar type III secretion system pore protein FliP [Pirellulaceae bacterium]